MNSKDREILRELAKKKLEIAKTPLMENRAEQWRLHNDCKGERPMVSFEVWFIGDKGYLPCEPKCESDEARAIEMQLLNDLFPYEQVGDDTVVTPEVRVVWRSSMQPFDMPVKREQANGIGYHITPQIEDLEKDFSLLKPSSTFFDKEGSLAWRDIIEDVIGDILEVRMASNALAACPTNEIVQRMGMENMLTNMLICPDEFKQMMDMLANDYVAWFKAMEAQEMLTPNNDNDGLNQGSLGFCTDLPGRQNGGKIKTTDLWGFIDSQETVGISPQQFAEFIFPYYKKIIECFGLVSYGCCEPVHVIWENCLSHLPNLRKLSISPWCDEAFMGQCLAGKKIIYHRKPSPNFVGVGTYLDEDAFRAHIHQTITCAKNCHLEFSFRDVYTLNGQFDKPRRAVEIVREEIDRYWNQ